MNKEITIIDYGVGNILSIKNAISFYGNRPVVTNDPVKIEKASHIILPGVGAFSAAMDKLKDLNLIKPLIKAKNNQSYILGICLGMQLLFTKSDEFKITNGLNFIKGNIKKLNKFNSDLNVKLPHIGWKNCNLESFKNNISIMKNISSKDEFYFVHSYALKDYTEDLNILESNYKSIKFPSVVNFKNIYGCQFHPEKSRTSGLKLIKNFSEL
ncbi:MAG: imidazole glycerol phosphate synthase subunit HisH [Candidatus Pelagibacter sp. TMED253]|nr:MAG: imidazole glycerol phosphate synthase subunit HisH [Candidatus Pelagibacter sp. TMED253]|tara:strand:- start:434 stop:1069 length:636 start_codon:yes stop_codon:yes gene_type:complete